MKKYIAFFRLRFVMGLQYRAAALAGVFTQFFWGFMEIMTFRAFYQADAAAFPMSFPAVASYIWLQQAFLAFFVAWMMENDIIESIVNGNVVYELCRPVSIYNMWFSRSIATRLSRAVLRCFPILIVAAFLPRPYGIQAPADVFHSLLFLVTLLLGLAVTVSFCMLVYVISFFTISAEGVRIVFVSSVEFFSGAIIPLPFFPEKIQMVMELLPFASMQNAALRIYSGSMTAPQMKKAVILQLFWLIVLIWTGRRLCARAEKRIIVQGG